jgi:hypothetical protein
MNNLLETQWELATRLQEMLKHFNARTSTLETCDLDDDELETINESQRLIAKVFNPVE